MRREAEVPQAETLPHAAGGEPQRKGGNVKTVGMTPPARGELRCERLADDTLLVHSWGTGRSAPERPSSPTCISSSTPAPGAAAGLRGPGPDSLGQPALDPVAPGAGGEHAPADCRRSAGPGRHPPPPGAGGRRRARAEGARRGAATLWLAHIGTVLAAWQGAWDMLGFIGRRSSPASGWWSARRASGASIWSSSCRNVACRPSALSPSSASSLA